MAVEGQRRALLLLGDYAEDYEVMVPFQSLLAFGLSVDAVCPGKKAGEVCPTAVHDFDGDQTYLELRGHNFVLNKSFDEVNTGDYHALVVAGGRAPEYLSIIPSVIDLVRHFFELKKPVASICHGQLILAAAGVLKGKVCTAYPACKPAIHQSGGIWKDPEPISIAFTDGLLVTGAAWPGHPELLKSLLHVMGASVSGLDKKILFLCGDFMEDYEIMVPFQALQAVGYTVHAVCPGKKSGEKCKTAIHDFEGDQTYSEKPGHKFTLNADFSGVSASAYDALVIPGGRSPEYLALNPDVLALVKSFESSKKVIASICHGQQILAAAGVLQGKQCTAYPALRPTIQMAGGVWLEPEPISKCFVDGNLITGAAWPAHPEFIQNILLALGRTVTFS